VVIPKIDKAIDDNMLLLIFLTTVGKI